METIITLSIIVAVLGVFVFYLLIRKIVADEMIESKDRMIMELQQRVDAGKQAICIQEAANRFKEFGAAISKMGATPGK